MQLDNLNQLQKQTLPLEKHTKMLQEQSQKQEFLQKAMIDAGMLGEFVVFSELPLFSSFGNYDILGNVFPR